MAKSLIALDTNIFIYALEGHDDFGVQARELVSSIDSGDKSAVASTYVLTELLRQGPQEMREALLSTRNMTFIPTSQEIALLAADIIRANSVKLSNIDAIHLATALFMGCREFWTNDKLLGKAKVNGLSIKMLGKY